jgi:hypothetical protein
VTVTLLGRVSRGMISSPVGDSKGMMIWVQYGTVAERDISFKAGGGELTTGHLLYGTRAEDENRTAGMRGRVGITPHHHYPSLMMRIREHFVLKTRTSVITDPSL